MGVLGKKAWVFLGKRLGVFWGKGLGFFWKKSWVFPTSTVPKIFRAVETTELRAVL